MGVLAGCFYGPWWGFLYTITGGLGAALLSYSVGRFFSPAAIGQNIALPKKNTRFHTHYLKKLRQNSFQALLVLHLLFFPYDLLNYTAGFLKISLKTFTLATFLGSTPGMLTVVLFGSALRGRRTFLAKSARVKCHHPPFIWVNAYSHLGHILFD